MFVVLGSIMHVMPVILIVLTLLLIGFVVGGLMGPPWVPTRKRDVDAVLKAATLKPGQAFIELGCGDGRLVAAAASCGAIAIGYEVNPLLWFIAVLRTIRYYPKARVRMANFWSKSLAEADVVMAFLVPRCMQRLAVKAQKEMKPGSRLISYIFQVPGKKAIKKSDHWFVYKY